MTNDRGKVLPLQNKKIILHYHDSVSAPMRSKMGLSRMNVYVPERCKVQVRVAGLSGHAVCFTIADKTQALTNALLQGPKNNI